MTTERIKIVMSESRPLSLLAAEWPTIASAGRHDGTIACQANREWAIRVREHADGRRIVYGWLDEGPGGMPSGWRARRGGFLVSSVDGAPDESATVRAIRRVGGIIDDDDMAAECIASLPAEHV